MKPGCEPLVDTGKGIRHGDGRAILRENEGVNHGKAVQTIRYWKLVKCHFLFVGVGPDITKEIQPNGKSFRIITC